MHLKCSYIILLVCACVCEVQIGDAMGWSEEGECVVLVLGRYVSFH